MLLQAARFLEIASKIGIINAIKLIIVLIRPKNSGKARLVRIYRTPMALRANRSDVYVAASWILGEDHIGHLKHHCKHLEIKSFIDAGANIGISTLVLNLSFPGSEVIAIEPDPDNRRILEMNIASMGATKSTIIEHPLWGEEVSMRPVNPDAPSWSREFSPENNDALGASSLRSVTLESLTFGKAQHSVFVKIDIEGGEKSVFESLSGEVIDRIGGFLIETHDRKVAGSGNAVITRLAGYGFNWTTHGENILAYRPRP